MPTLPEGEFQSVEGNTFELPPARPLEISIEGKTYSSHLQFANVLVEPAQGVGQ